ncbi:DUF3822 family protein [Prevotella nigrescens]
MVQIDNNIPDRCIRLTLRISESSMLFAVGDPQADDNFVFEPYNVNNSISVAANLREAFKKSELLQSGYKRALVAIDAPTMLVPLDEYKEQDAETLYKHTLKWQRSEDILTSTMPKLNAVAVFAVSKDLKMVVDNHFENIQVQPQMQAVWTHLYKYAFAGIRQKLFAYFHDKRMEVIRFQRNRFEFCNSYGANSTQDILYYLLYVWKLMGMDRGDNELYLAGNVPNRDELCTELQQFVNRYHVLEVATDFNNATMATQKEIPYDLKALYLG